MRTLLSNLYVLVAIAVAIIGSVHYYDVHGEWLQRYFSSEKDQVSELIQQSEQEFVGDELNWLTKAIYFEARSEPLMGRLMVAKTVLSRVADRRWPGTVEAVVRQGEEKLHRCQFSFMCDGKPEHVNDLEAWLKAYDEAKIVYGFYQRGELDTSVHSYHATYAKRTGYFQTLALVDQVGAHKFYADR